jgi:ADP-ribose pyrophosphatase YjhB (NUDIX family)
LKHHHPHKNEKGQLVELLQPSQATELATWDHPEQRASVTPNGPMPAMVGGLAIDSWRSVPTSVAGWEQLAQRSVFDEEPLKYVSGKSSASGAVVVEADGRVWVVSPSNGFGGYTNTFPKGKLETKAGLGLRANALKEVFEESGLAVELTGFLCDSVRSTSVTRYYLAHRVGGNPAEMCWESQAVHLVPMAQLAQFVAHPKDQLVVQTLRSLPRTSVSDIVSYKWGLSSVHRILATVAGFRKQYGFWPSRLLLDRGMFEDIPKYILSPLGWKLLNQKLDIIVFDEGTIYAERPNAERVEYDINQFNLQGGPSVCFWIWGVELVNN